MECVRDDCPAFKRRESYNGTDDTIECTICKWTLWKNQKFEKCGIDEAIVKMKSDLHKAERLREYLKSDIYTSY